MSVCVVGVLVSHLLYGYYQEQLMTHLWAQPTGANSNMLATAGVTRTNLLVAERAVHTSEAPTEQFLHASFVTMLNRLFSLVLALLAIGIARLINRGPLDMSAAPLWEYSIAALANNVSSVSQYAPVYAIASTGTHRPRDHPALPC